MYRAYDLIPINVGQRLDHVAHRAGAIREGGDNIEYRGSDRRHGWLPIRARSERARTRADCPGGAKHSLRFGRVQQRGRYRIARVSVHFPRVLVDRRVDNAKRHVYSMGWVGQRQARAVGVDDSQVAVAVEQNCLNPNWNAPLVEPDRGQIVYAQESPVRNAIEPEANPQAPIQILHIKIVPDALGDDALRWT